MSGADRALPRVAEENVLRRDGLEQPEAFHRLRGAARSAGRSVGDVAREPLAGEGDPGARDAGGLR